MQREKPPSVTMCHRSIGGDPAPVWPTAFADYRRANRRARRATTEGSRCPCLGQIGWTSKILPFSTSKRCSSSALVRPARPYAEARTATKPLGPRRATAATELRCGRGRSSRGRPLHRWLSRWRRDRYTSTGAALTTGTGALGCGASPRHAAAAPHRRCLRRCDRSRRDRGGYRACCGKLAAARRQTATTIPHR
jgi:hypothetical protein